MSRSLSPEKRIRFNWNGFRKNATSKSNSPVGGLKPIKESLPEEITYGEIRLVAAHQRVQSVQ